MCLFAVFLLSLLAVFLLCGRDYAHRIAVNGNRSLHSSHKCTLRQIQFVSPPETRLRGDPLEQPKVRCSLAYRNDLESKPFWRRIVNATTVGGDYAHSG